MRGLSRLSSLHLEPRRLASLLRRVNDGRRRLSRLGFGAPRRLLRSIGAFLGAAYDRAKPLSLAEDGVDIALNARRRASCGATLRHQSLGCLDSGVAENSGDAPLRLACGVGLRWLVARTRHADHLALCLRIRSYLQVDAELLCPVALCAKVIGAGHADDHPQNLEFTLAIHRTRRCRFLHGLLHRLWLHEPDRLVILAAIEEPHASSKEKVEQRDESNDGECEEHEDQHSHVARTEQARSIEKSSSRAGCATCSEVDHQLAGPKSAVSVERARRMVRTARAETRAVRACRR
eukprot:7387989-Prymnesium_polylepis.1